jgi:hypothetical protein
MMGFRPFTDALRTLGFELDSKAQIDGDRIMAFRKRVSPARVVDVQLWSDGSHRASHSLHGSMNTFPTDFKTVEGMRRAIEHERTRTDNRDYVSPSVENFEGGCVTDASSG